MRDPLESRIIECLAAHLDHAPLSRYMPFGMNKTMRLGPADIIDERDRFRVAIQIHQEDDHE